MFQEVEAKNGYHPDLDPTENEIKIFSEAVSETLQNLSFESKQAMIRNTVSKIVGTQLQLQASGNIPLSFESNVVYKTISGNCWSAKRGEVHAF